MAKFWGGVLPFRRNLLDSVDAFLQKFGEDSYQPRNLPAAGGPRGEIMNRCDKFQAAEVVGSCCAFFRDHTNGVPGNIKMPWWNPWWSTSDRSETDDSGNGSDLALANFKRCNTPNDASSRIWVLLYFLVALGSNPPENLLFMKCLSYIFAYFCECSCLKTLGFGDIKSQAQGFQLGPEQDRSSQGGPKMWSFRICFEKIISFTKLTFFPEIPQQFFPPKKPFQSMPQHFHAGREMKSIIVGTVGTWQLGLGALGKRESWRKTLRLGWRL